MYDRPTLPPHLLAQVPTNLASRPLNSEQAEMFVDGLIQGLQQVQSRAGLTVYVDKDADGWTIRINLSK